jgi:predicted hydrocarbon binding protein
MKLAVGGWREAMVLTAKPPTANCQLPYTLPMSLLMQQKTQTAPHRLEGKEVLVGPDPTVAKVKGVMFGGRKAFLLETLGEQGFAQFLQKLTPRTRGYVKMPMASSWCEFESLIELDRAIHNELKAQYPNVLALIGAASAELGIGRVYQALDSESLLRFLEDNALFHDQYQKFGNVKFEKTPTGARMIYAKYPCYSPLYCASAFGYFQESILRHGGADPVVTETKCQCHGDRTCTFEMTWK